MSFSFQIVLSLSLLSIKYLTYAGGHVYSLDGADKSPKYFHEAPWSFHYDGRFAEEQIPYDDRRIALTFLVQTYLATMNEIGIETWIMHGSLLGWYWNHKILPWDDDIDVMISEKSIHHLAGYYNMTMHHYNLPDVPAGRDYMLEVNPNYILDSRDDDNNKIDARWIDTQTGLFTDITTLRRDSGARAKDQDGAMMVKDGHHYHLDDIFPLRDMKFEGMRAWIPWGAPKLLAEEYGQRSMSATEVYNRRFDMEKQEWVPISCREYASCDVWRAYFDKYKMPKSLLDDAWSEESM